MDNAEENLPAVQAAEKLPPDIAHIVLQFADGTVGVMQYIVNDQNGVVQEVTPEEIEATIAKMEKSLSQSENQADLDKLPVQSYKVVPADTIPTDRSYRNAWRHNGQEFTHDMPQARSLHMDKLRQQRSEELAKKDIEWMRAFSCGDQAEAGKIEADRQKLRDMPTTLAPDIEACNNVEQLKAITLETVKTKGE